eukprot:269106_1
MDVDLDVLSFSYSSRPFESVPDHLITVIVSFLSLKQLLIVSSTSSRFKKACNVAFKWIRNISLYIYDLSDTDTACIDPPLSIHHTTSHIYMQLLWNNGKNHRSVINLLNTVWSNVYCFHSEQHSICTIMKHLGLPHHQMEHIRLLADPTNSYLNNIHHFTNLQWIDTKYSGKTLWNALIKYCPHLHGISFQYFLDSMYPSADGIQFELAPNVWTFSIYLDGDALCSCDVDTMNAILLSIPNLKYLQMAGSTSLYVSDATSNIVRVPSGLVALKVNCECLNAITYDISPCTNLRFIDLELRFFTENIESEDLSEFHRPLSALLVAFLEINRYTVFPKLIGIALNYDNGTPSVSKADKLAAITQYKAILEESDVLDLYRDGGNQLVIVSTKCVECVSCSCVPDTMVDVWSDLLFSIPIDRIMKGDHVNEVVRKLLSGMSDGMDDGCLDFFQHVVSDGLY